MEKYCYSCKLREEENHEDRKNIYCTGCGEIMTKLTKEGNHHCRECGRPYVTWYIECDRKNSFWAGLLFFMWGYHDRAFLKHENIEK